ncbi:hypothetical protein AS19_17130 [Alcanivorax sp. NBRC 101098]|uniref:ATP-binding protein n=1 Tax=Alcanivorax sp. NBRC 101098 TaxID=1113728 RepID=UPI0004ABDB59|nr:ATP-binding protein [Alcanivorax sp. NBRC 101098]BAP14564.1 hypothetical protein AS19_17130 [Alcanivorax sp. NBRC 101098]
MSNEMKRKSAMVLHEIEEALGCFVLNNGNVDNVNLDRLENIHKRELDKGREFNKSSIKDVVEATYLDELFGFVMDITRDSSVEGSVNYLYSLFHHLDVYEVRNAISHPNRPFWDCYWYRVASIASDPVNEVLGLDGIKEALAAAESGKISDPPEEWVNKIIWQIPNNLPDIFDHGLTGLIGRSKELSELKKFISNRRVNTIALVAPGGAGKTALALDLLNSIVSSPKFTKYVDAVVYCSMKTEKLTSEGVISLDAAETIDELKVNILESINEIFDECYSDIESAIQAKEDLNVLLCVDNLETLLRDNHDAFEELNFSLPSNWKVLVTSRVAISNSTIMSLESLKEKSAVHLARTYISKRGGADLENEEYIKLTKSCFYNPLAIRLTLDLVLVGKDVPSSLNVANKEIAEFSYNNLIDALTVSAIEIMEAVFVEGSSSRLSLCELLDKTLDEISSAIGELSKTSLIIRGSSDQGEVYTLSDSVKDLLIISPRNIDVRNSVQDKIHKRRVLSKEIDIKQADKELPKWHPDYVPSETAENLKILVSEVCGSLHKAKKSTDLAVSLFRKLKDSSFIYDKEYLYHKSFARVLEILKDYNAAEKHYKESIDINPEDPSSKYLLARLCHATKRYSDAYDIYLELERDGWIDLEQENVSFGKSIYNGMFLALLYDGRHDDALEKTKKWKESGVYRGVLGTYRASAWKRKMENAVDSDPELAAECLVKSSRILSDVFRSEGYFRVVNKQAVKIFEEIEFCFSRSYFSARFPNQGIELLSFIANNLVDVARDEKNLRLNVFVDKLRNVEIKDNPFQGHNWKAFSCSNDDFFHDDSDAVPVGLVGVKITNRPKEKASYMFAKDSNGNDYFLHYNNFKDGNWRVWCHISIGDSLNVVADATADTTGKATNAKEIYMST